jgi:hypothetical protein
LVVVLVLVLVLVWVELRDAGHKPQCARPVIGTQCELMTDRA